jgi:hypothetical protein
MQREKCIVPWSATNRFFVHTVVKDMTSWGWDCGSVTSATEYIVMMVHFMVFAINVREKSN